MLITCPSCATHHNIQDDDFVADGAIIKCTSCGHSWLEASAIEITDLVSYEGLDSHEDLNNHDNDGYSDYETFANQSNLPAIPQAPNTEYEAVRIAKAVKQAEQTRLEAVAKRRKKIRSWLALAACVCAPFSVAAAFPESTVRALPGTIAIYNKVGIDVNIHGLTFANITHQYLLANGTRVLAIRGVIVNVSGKQKTVPSLRFSLRDKTKNEVFNWTLNGVSKRPLKAGAATTFLTRIAQPPKHADDFQIRFALEGEIVKTASHESYSNKRTQN